MYTYKNLVIKNIFLRTNVKEEIPHQREKNAYKWCWSDLSKVSIVYSAH